MLGWIARLLFLRFLPRRLVPLVTVWQVFQMLRSRRNRARERSAADRSGLPARRSPPR